MAQAPFISVFEVLPDGSYKDLGKLCGPRELFALAAAMTYAEHTFLEAIVDDEVARGAIGFIKQFKAPKPVMEMFDWYCVTCSQSGRIAGEESWREKPEHFSRRVRAFLAYLLFSGVTMEGNPALINALIFKMYREAFEHERELQKKENAIREKPLVRILKVILFPIIYLSRLRAPKYELEIDDGQWDLADQLAQKLVELGRAAKKENKKFSFDQPLPAALKQ